MFKYWSPMSVATFVLPLFGVFAFLSFLGALADAGKLRWRGALNLRPPSLLGKAIAVLGALLGLYVAGYHGVLLAVTNRPVWSDTPLLGMLLIVSAASVSIAFLILLSLSRHRHLPAVDSLRRMAVWVIGLELVVLAAFVVLLGPSSRAWLNAWGLLLALGVVLLGMVTPTLLLRSRDLRGGSRISVAAALVLIGDFILRTVIVMSVEGIGRWPAS